MTPLQPARRRAAQRAQLLEPRLEAPSESQQAETAGLASLRTRKSAAPVQPPRALEAQAVAALQVVLEQKQEARQQQVVLAEEREWKSAAVRVWNALLWLQPLLPLARKPIFPRPLAPAAKSTENVPARSRRPQHQWNSSGFSSQ